MEAKPAGVTSGTSVNPCLTDAVDEFFEGSTPMTCSIADAFTCDLNSPGACPAIPEKGLLAAILWRSFADLEEHINHLDRKAAINWFRADGSKVQGSRFTFQEIIFYLNLGEMELKILYNKIEQAEQIELRREKILSENYKCTILE